MVVQIILTGDVQKHEESFRARVDGLGVHAYGATADEAQERALRASLLKLDVWAMQGVLIPRLKNHSVQFDLDIQADVLPAPRELVHMALSPA